MASHVWILALVGLGLAGFGVPLMLRRVRPNGFYGLRVPATYRDEQVWYDANAAAGRDLVVLGAGVFALAVVPPRLGWDADTHVLVWSIAVGIGAMACTVVGWRRANRMLRERFPGPR